MKVTDLIPEEDLSDAILNGYVKQTYHPELPYAILNYTDRAQIQKHWTLATRLCRGLIIDRDRNVVARPFGKFFNYQEVPSDELFDRMDDAVVVTDKMDGSLGIMYQTPLGRPTIATRGSFTSDQAIHANEILRSKYPNYRPPLGWTMLFEIIYPDNRIVVDYNGLDDLVLLGGVHIQSGIVFGPDHHRGWPGPRAEVFALGTLRQALSARSRPGKEGMVVLFPWSDTMLKIKQEDYVHLHRIVTGLNEKEVWRRTMNAYLTIPPECEKMPTILDGIPDELHEWIRSIAIPLAREHRDMYRVVTDKFRTVRDVLLSRGWTTMEYNRKEFARLASNYHPWVKTCLFMILDGQHDKAKEFLWKKLEPKGDRGPR